MSCDALDVAVLDFGACDRQFVSNFVLWISGLTSARHCPGFSASDIMGLCRCVVAVVVEEL